MHIPHPYGIGGLLLNTLAAVLLLIFPPGAEGIRPDGTRVIDRTFGFLQLVGRGRYLFLTWGFRVSMLLFFVGFILQGVDLLTS
jgi:hypothetical protein